MNNKNFRIRLNQSETRVVKIFFDSHSVQLGVTNRSKHIALYPLSDRTVKALFIYGDDYQRRIASPVDIILNYWFIPLWFSLTAIILHFIRLKFRIQENSISSSILMMITIFFGGGTIRVRHKLERYFIVILLFGMFFLQSLWVGDFLSKISSSRYMNSVDTIKKLSKLNTPIYFANILGHEKEHVVDILK